ncbi:MAG TPA: PQQ-binding-like beta-propeller repeat protein [Sedimentisphaerales bacterium]|nr:PQQ-binding-like beta-propeller repeat protein [Sedimentisphaerales bacterium]
MVVAVVWSQEKAIPTQWSAESNIKWKTPLPGKYSASPVCADGKVYFLSESGKGTVIEEGPHYKLVAQNDLGETCCASPAISRGNLFLRFVYSRPTWYGMPACGVVSAFGVAVVMGIVTEIFREPRATRPSVSFVARTGSTTSSGTLYVHRQDS